MKTGDKPRNAQPMVGWYHPRTLLHSGWLVGISNLFGRHSDTRLIEALASQSQSRFDYSSQATGGFWLDFVCDTGDGWDPTYAIASSLAEPSLEVADLTGKRVKTQRGSVLVFGGDEVYPYPSRQAYVDRTETPYAMAFAGREKRPEIFAVPGNHDWYDSLIAFSRMFCRPKRGFAGCRTRQTRSYFALELPGQWWLLALDLQLGAEMDEPQARYFEEVAERLGDDAKLVVCVPEPRWIYEKAYPEYRQYTEDPVIESLERIFGCKVRVFLTGDLHFYKRHSNSVGVQKITCGGGGAFLHPTHAPSTRSLRDGFVERAVFPDERTSRRLAWHNGLFPLLNPYYGVLPGSVYALSAWFASSRLLPEDVTSIGRTLEATVNAAIRHPVNGLWMLAVVSAFVFFTDTHKRWWRVFGGVSHALLQIAGAFFVGWWGHVITARVLGLEFASSVQLLTAGALTFILGGLVGGFLMGLYLFISVQVFGRHSTEAFSSLHIKDYKSWLRLHVDESGSLSLFCIGLKRVPRRWRRILRCGEETYISDDEAATPPHLVDFVRLG